jgi:hypothetical protein
MDYANERYVRLYTRDTTTVKLLGWQGRLVWWSLLRKLDRIDAGLADRGLGWHIDRSGQHQPERVTLARV